MGVSPSSRRAWIEMLFVDAVHWEHKVALLAEGVDRNSQTGSWDDTSRQVALLAEGVDRNT